MLFPLNPLTSEATVPERPRSSFIPAPRPAAFGMQYAGWEPSVFAVDGLGVRVLPDQRIPVDDGITLSADVYTPAVAGRYPAVVSFSAYNFERHTAGLPTGSNEIGSPPVFTGRGYCPVVVERRGMGRSDGETGMFFSETDITDHEKVIEWAAAQPWCNGEVVLFGTSYYGMTQPLVAARRPPALRAFFANEICTDFIRQLALFGGVPNLYFFNVWMGANFTQKQLDLRMNPRLRAAISEVTNGPAHPLIEKTVHRHVDHVFKEFMAATPIDPVLEIYSHWLFDDKSRADATIPEGSSPVLDRIEVPFVTVQNLGYFNLHQFGSYELHEKASTPDGQKWLILAPPSFELPEYGWQDEALAFFDHVLHGTQNGYAAQPPVRYWVNGADTFHTAESFPPAATTRRRLYLARRGDDTEIQELTVAVSEAGSNAWAAVPIGVPTLGGLDKFAPQTIAYEFPVTEPVELAGAVTLTLSFSSTEIDSYVVARVCRVDGDGRMHHLSLGAIRPAARVIDASRGSAVEIAIDPGRRDALTPGEPVELRFSLTPGPVRLAPGEKLRLDLGSRTDLLRLGPGDGYVQFDLPVPPFLSRNTVHYDGASYIDLDLVPVRAERDQSDPE